MAISKKLETCPFCGSKYIGVIIPIEKEYQVQCGDCYASSSIESTEKKAIKAWNRRAETAVTEPLTCNGCTYQADFPSHEKCHGCARAYTDHYRRPPEGEKNET